MPARLTRAVGVAAVIAAVAGILIAGPSDRWEEFKQVEPLETESTYVAAHLTSGRGSGRYQYWSTALDAFEDHPVRRDRRRRQRGLLGPARLPGAAGPGRSFAVLREHGRAWRRRPGDGGRVPWLRGRIGLSPGPGPLARGSAGRGAGGLGSRHRLGGDRLDLGAAGVLRPRGARRGAAHGAGDARARNRPRAHAPMRSTAQERDV